MTDVRDFIRRRIAELETSQSAVSLAINKNQTYVQQYLTKGTPRSLDEDTRKALAVVLGCNESDLKERRPLNDNSAGPDVALRHPIPGIAGPVGGPAKDRTLPVFGRAQAGSYGMAIIPTDDRPIDWTYRPGQLEGVEGAYATFIHGDSMSPAFEEGDLALVHPHSTTRHGDDVHIILRTDEAFVKRLVSRRDTAIKVQQFNPPREFEIDPKTIRSIRKVVGKWSR